MISIIIWWFHLQDNQITYDAGIFISLYLTAIYGWGNCTTEQLHHRSEPPWEEDLGLFSNLQPRKAVSILGLTQTTWHLPECDLSSERDSSFNYLVHTDHVLLSYWGFSCFSTIKKWHKNTSSKAPWIGTQVPEDRLRGRGETSVGHPPTSLGSQQGMKEQFSSQTPLYEDPAPHRSQPLRQVGAGGGKRGHFLGSVVWWRASQVGTEPWVGKGGAAPRAGPRLQAGRGDWWRL